MAYELSIPVKGGTLEIEFDDLDEMERKLGELDVARIERALAAALRAGKGARKGAAKKGARGTTRKGAKRSAKKGK